MMLAASRTGNSGGGYCLLRRAGPSKGGRPFRSPRGNQETPDVGMAQAEDLGECLPRRSVADVDRNLVGRGNLADQISEPGTAAAPGTGARPAWYMSRRIAAVASRPSKTIDSGTPGVPSPERAKNGPPQGRGRDVGLATGRSPCMGPGTPEARLARANPGLWEQE